MLGFITYFWVQHHNGRAFFEGESSGSFNSTICIYCNKNFKFFDCVSLVNMFEIVKVKIIQCTFKIRKKYLDVSRLQSLYHPQMIAFNLLVCIFIERDNLKKVIQFYYIGFVAFFCVN